MASINKLKGKIVEKGINISKLAELMDIDRATLYRKLSGGGDKITIREANEISRILGLTKEEVNTIFFDHNVAWYAN